MLGPINIFSPGILPLQTFYGFINFLFCIERGLLWTTLHFFIGFMESSWKNIPHQREQMLHAPYSHYFSSTRPTSLQQPFGDGDRPSIHRMLRIRQSETSCWFHAMIYAMFLPHIRSTHALLEPREGDTDSLGEFRKTLADLVHTLLSDTKRHVVNDKNILKVIEKQLKRVSEQERSETSRIDASKILEALHPSTDAIDDISFSGFEDSEQSVHWLLDLIQSKDTVPLRRKKEKIVWNEQDIQTQLIPKMRIHMQGHKMDDAFYGPTTLTTLVHATNKVRVVRKIDTEGEKDVWFHHLEFPQVLDRSPPSLDTLVYLSDGHSQFSVEYPHTFMVYTQSSYPSMDLGLLGISSVRAYMKTYGRSKAITTRSIQKLCSISGEDLKKMRYTQGMYLGVNESAQEMFLPSFILARIYQVPSEYNPSKNEEGVWAKGSKKTHSGLVPVHANMLRNEEDCQKSFKIRWKQALGFLIKYSKRWGPVLTEWFSQHGISTERGAVVLDEGVLNPMGEEQPYIESIRVRATPMGKIPPMVKLTLKNETTQTWIPFDSKTPLNHMFTHTLYDGNVDEATGEGRGEWMSLEEWGGYILCSSRETLFGGIKFLRPHIQDTMLFIRLMDSITIMMQPETPMFKTSPKKGGKMVTARIMQNEMSKMLKQYIKQGPGHQEFAHAPNILKQAISALHNMGYKVPPRPTDMDSFKNAFPHDVPIYRLSTTSVLKIDAIQGDVLFLSIPRGQHGIQSLIDGPDEPDWAFKLPPNILSQNLQHMYPNGITVTVESALITKNPRGNVAGHWTCLVRFREGWWEVDTQSPIPYEEPSIKERQCSPQAIKNILYKSSTTWICKIQTHSGNKE